VEKANVLVSYGIFVVERGIKRRCNGHACEAAEIYADHQCELGLQTAVRGKLTDVQELNAKRLRKEPFELCRALEETVQGDAVSTSPPFERM
jgi:hypothetical protein